MDMSLTGFYAVTWSAEAQKFMIEPLSETLRMGAESYLNALPSDYILVAIGRTAQDANLLMLQLTEQKRERLSAYHSSLRTYECERRLFRQRLLALQLVQFSFELHFPLGGKPSQFRILLPAPDGVGVTMHQPRYLDFSVQLCLHRQYLYD